MAKKVKKIEEKKDYKITLEMNREQAIHLMRACETMARIGMGQFMVMVDLLVPLRDYDDAKEIERYLKSKIFPEMSLQGYHGIRQDQVNESCQVAWDAYQHLRREVSWLDDGKDWRTEARDWKTMMGVNYDNPMKSSKVPGEFKTERVEDKKPETDDEFYDRVANEDM